MAKQKFFGLVRFKGSSADYEKQKENGTGKLIFAHVVGEKAGKYIYANGLEYKVADSTNLDDLVARVNALESSMGTLEAWKNVVNGSIEVLNKSVENHEGRIKALENASTALAERIADVSQDVINISTYVHNTVDTSITDISNRLSNVGITADNNKLTVNGKDVALSGSDYVTVTVANNSVNVSLNAEKIQDGSNAANGHEKLATKGYVDEQIAVLEQALVFKGEITAVDASSQLTDQDVQAGYTYVATDKGTYNGKTFEEGDLIIVKTDAVATTVAEIIVVERNLDGAVTAGTALEDDYVILGNGNQKVKASTLSITALNTAITNANSALQNVTASTLSNFVTVAAVKDASAVNVSVGVTTHDVSTATSDANGLATALNVKEYVDAKAGDIKVKATLNSSTPIYVDATASVDDATGRIITASVGVKTATLADASKGTDGLATAMDVYTELTAVETTIATANTTMANTIGLNSNYSVTWSTASGIAADTSIVKAIEEVAQKAEAAKQSGVTSFGGATGAISVDTANNTDGSVKFTMDGSTLKGAVNGWSTLTTNISNNATAIGDVSTRVNDISTRLNDLSTYVRETVDASIDALQAKDTEIDASIDRLDTSVSALETELAKHTVKSIEGETGITERANDDYVAVSATKDAEGNVTLDSSVQLATNVDLTGINGATAAEATGLATDATVKDYVTYALAWEVIGE